MSCWLKIGPPDAGTPSRRWKAKYGGPDVNEARRLKSLGDENRRLKAAVADLTLDNRMLKDVLAKKC